MREIKFRAWDKEHNVMRNFERIAGWSMSELNDKDTSQLYMQYTGLKDKNGKEIYEEDIVTSKYQKLAKVVWVNEMASFATETIDDIVKNEFQFCLSDITEIIGNIYENKELLN